MYSSFLSVRISLMYRTVVFSEQAESLPLEQRKHYAEKVCNRLISHARYKQNIKFLNRWLYLKTTS